MAIQDICYLDHEVGIHVYGEPSDVDYFMSRTDAVGIMIAGYDVKNMGDAQHDGHDAIRFTLMADNREVGRLVVMAAASTEYTFEFDVLFDDELKRDAWVESFRNPPAPPQLVQSTQDLVFEGESLESVIANLSALYGVSINVIERAGSGGGWPSVKVSGRLENVKRALVEGWRFEEGDIETMVVPFRA